jgi:hypothetical protein
VFDFFAALQAIAGVAVTVTAGKDGEPIFVIYKCEWFMQVFGALKVAPTLGKKRPTLAGWPHGHIPLSKDARLVGIVL